MKLVSLGVSAEIIVVIQNQDSGLGADGFAEEVRRGKPTDAAADDHQVIGFTAVGRRGGLVPELGVAHLVRHFKGAFVAATEAR